MKLSQSTQLLYISTLLTGSVNGFAFVDRQRCRATNMALEMGLFDGVKDAFSAPALERSSVDVDRETPIDRWFGWSTASSDATETEEGSKGMCLDFCRF